jgi:hypothetical protein
MSDGLTLEKLKLVDSVNDLKTTVETLVKVTELNTKHTAEHVARLQNNVDLLNIIVNGEGDKKGMNERLRNLESYAGVIWISFCGVVVLGVKTAWAMIFGK